MSDKSAMEYDRFLFEKAPYGIFIANSQGRCLDVNPAGEKLTGYTRQQLLKMSLPDLLATEARQQALDLFQSLQHQNSAYGEFSFQKKDGTTCWLSLTAERMDEKRILAFCYDITNRVQAEKVLHITDAKLHQQNEEFLTINEELRQSYDEMEMANTVAQKERHEKQLILDAISDMVMYHDLHMHVVWTNKNAAEAVGKAVSEIKGKPCYENFGDDPRQICQNCPVKQAMEEKRVIKTRKTRKDGRIWDIWAYPVYDRHSQLQGVVETMTDVTQIVKAQQELKNSEQKYRRIAENVSDVIWISDLNLQTTYVSPSIKKLTGETPQEHISKSAAERIPLDQLQKISRILAEELEKEKDPQTPKDRSMVLETQHYKADGTTQWISINASFIRDERGNPAGIQGVSRNIDAQKKLEDELRESESRHKSIIAVSNTGAWEYDSEKDYLWCSPEYFTMLGYSPADFNLTQHGNFAPNWIELLHPDDRKSAPAIFAQYLTNGSQGLYENHFRMRHKDGHWRWIWSRGQTLKDELGQNTPITVGTHIDITDQKKLQQSIFENEQRLAATLQSIGDGVIVCDARGHIDLLNAVAESLTGWKNQDAKGLPVEKVFHIIHSQTRERAENVVRQALQNNATVELANHILLIAKDGTEYHIADSCAPIHDGEKNLLGAVLVFRDISQQYRQREELKKSEASLKEAQMIAQMGRWDYNHRNNRLTWSDTLYMIFEIKPENIKLSTQVFLDLVDPLDREKVNDTLKKSWNTQKPYKIDYRIRTPKGKIKWVEEHSETVFDAKGHPVSSMGIIKDVTTAKNTEIALRENEAKYRTFFETNTDGIIIFTLNEDLTIEIKEHNPALTELIGYRLRPNDLFSLFRLEPNITKQSLEKRIDEVFQKGIATFETVLLHKDGHKIDVNVKAIPIDFLGKPAIYSIIREISEQKQMERLMQARLRLMEYAENHSLPELLRRTLAEAEALTESKIGFYHFIDEDKGQISLNQWSERTHREFCKVNRSFPEHYSIKEAGVWTDCVHTRKPVIHNNYDALPHKKGLPPGHAPVVRELNVPVIRNRKIMAVLGIGNKASDYNARDVNTLTQLADLAWDIAERKMGQQKLRESEEKYRLIFEKSPLGVLHFDNQGVITECNSPFVNIIGSSRQKLVGLNMMKLPDQNIVQCIQTVISGKPATYEGMYESVTATKTTPVRLLFAPIINSEGTVEGGIGLVEDRSSFMQKEEFKKQVEVAREAARFKQNFLANMSHEIRTPLTGIMGMMEIFQQTPLNEQQQEYLNILRSSGENLREIINQVLDFSKIEAGKVRLNPSVFEFKAIMEDAQKLYAGICKPNVKMNIQLDPQIPDFIEADKNRISQVVNNLISNAVKFTHKGRINLRASLQSVLTDTRELIIKMEVQDTGIGIPAQLQEKLFTPFSQIDERDTRIYEGTGLGLSISKELVNLHGGEMGIHSKPQQGSTFWFTFLAKQSDDQPEILKEPKHPSSHRGKKKLRILFAEDKVVNQKVVQIMLLSMGHEVVLARNGQQALDLFNPTNFDLILMDIQMPVMDGITATQKLKEKYQDLPPIVGLSANAFEGDREKYMKMGMDEYLTKPVKREDFIHIMEKLFD